MADCDGFFDNEGIPFTPGFDDAAVRAVRIADFHDPTYKKWLILCWFDTTYGVWDGLKYSLRNSREKMREYLATTEYKTFEELISDNERQN